MLKSLFEIVLFEDTGNQWSLSRPMLSMILISEQVMSTISRKRVECLSLSLPTLFFVSFLLFKKKKDVLFPFLLTLVNVSFGLQIYADLRAQILASQV